MNNIPSLRHRRDLVLDGRSANDLDDSAWALAAFMRFLSCEIVHGARVDFSNFKNRSAYMDWGMDQA
ncbi:MAG TPA: hypothetical protein VK325_05480 [Pseudoxanthomonas sp.]|nr:hypothetical protein [Pseudoxanthomonas sp.]